MSISGEERKKGSERIFEEIMAENFPNLMKEMNINTQEDWYMNIQVRWTQRNPHWDTS